MRLRPYKTSDAEYIVKWFEDERKFAMWSAGKFSYPLTREQLTEHERYWNNQKNGWIFTALDQQGIPVGHLLMRKADYEKNSIHFGFIVVDPAIRGKGYGKEMVRLAGQYAFGMLGMERITLGVYTVNEAAHGCYLSLGFQDEKLVKNALIFEKEPWDLYEMAWEKEFN